MKNISFSEVKIYEECPWKHKLLYRDKVVKQKKTQYLAFGLAFHATIEELHKNPECVPVLFFEERLIAEFLLIVEEEVFRKKTRQQEYDEMLGQGKQLVVLIIPALKEKFPEYQFIDSEEKLEILLTSIEASQPFQFKGYIDFIIKLPSGRTIIIDFKTSSLGWTAQEKTNKITTYQLTLYKHFYCEKYSINPKEVEVYFAIIKRTGKKEHFDIFEVGCGTKKVSNCIEFLKGKVKLIDKKVLIKKYDSCHKKTGFFINTCDFYKTEHCR